MIFFTCRVLKFVCVMFILYFVVGVASAEQRDFYTVELEVKDRSAMARAQAISEAFEHVLIRLTGNLAVLTLPIVRENLPEAQSVLREYSYIERAGQLKLRAKFDQRMTNDLLNLTEQPRWPDNRPVVLIWLAKIDGQQLDFVGAQATNTWQKALLAAAEKRGLPIILPLLDLAEQAQLPITDNNRLDIAAFRKAGQRYNAALSLVGRIAPAEKGGWQADWALVFSEDQMSWRELGDTPEEAIAEGLNTVVDALVARYYSIDLDADAPLRLRVAGVGGIADYARLTEALQKVRGITQLELSSISSQAVVYQLQFPGGQSELQKQLATIDFIQPAAEVESYQLNQLDYQLKS